MKALGLVESQEAKDGFYPTPPELAEKLLDGINWKKSYSILEPSAGKGNLIKAIWDAQSHEEYLPSYASVDCVELDPMLRSILKDNFVSKHFSPTTEKLHDLTYRSQNSYKLGVEALSRDEYDLKRSLEQETRKFGGTQVRIIHDNFLTFYPTTAYDLIVMNPPFANGDEHLLKAIQMQERFGGMIRCILNAETIRNPFSAKRQLLIRKLGEYNADVKFVKNGFTDAERKTDVEVAIIAIDIPEVKNESDIFNRIKQAKEAEDYSPKEIKDIATRDFVGNVVRQYTIELEAGLELIKKFVDMQPYITVGFEPELQRPLLQLNIGEASVNASEKVQVNGFVKTLRRKYWTALFSNKAFVGTMTTNLRHKYQGMVDKLVDYDFTAFNIQVIANQIATEVQKGIQETIVELFDKLTVEHSWYSECESNKHYFNGWATNKAWKINSKVILPINGMYSHIWNGMDRFVICDTLTDIEKVFDYFGGEAYEIVDLHGTICEAIESGQTKKIRLKYFDIDLFKKGTCHIKFRDPQLVDRFNIYCCQSKNWLPPSYGKKMYSDMDEKEREVVDGFDGKGEKGSGEVKYNTVMQNKESYFTTIGSAGMLLLGE